MIMRITLWCYFTAARHTPSSCFFFFNDTATTEIYTLSLHDALPISGRSLPDHDAGASERQRHRGRVSMGGRRDQSGDADRKSTRLNSSHQIISYAVFCLKKKKRTPHKTLTIPTLQSP